MWEWLKKVLNPTNLLIQAIDSLDLLVPALAYELDKAKAKFAAMNSTEKALWIVDQVQAFLRKKFNLPPEVK